ncbi:MAG TPA: BON domain-containing protein [Casimicrobiaceae bacterium]|jgi:osmotically-inducible protein OsmY|nr:BON domain-containing protein [Casimicrobiaceae bacterium]
MKRFDAIMRIAATMSLAASAMLLNGCIPLAITGVAASAQIATDRRTTGAQLDDELIEDKAIAQIADRLKNDIHVNVTSYNGIALLTGEVPTEGTKNEVAQIVRSMPKVRIVQNELVIGPTSSLSARTNDTFITSKVKTRFVELHDKFQINHVKVVTERSVVYLMGIVRRDEGDAAAQAARTTSGVERVVKVFEYIS